jgi:hypothetical protein
VTLQRAVRAATVFDPVAREPVRQLWHAGEGPGLGSAVDLLAQVNWDREGRIGEPRSHAGGVQETTTGYLLFRVADLLAAGVATANSDGTLNLGIARGDRITRIGRRAVDLYVTFFRDVGNYPDQGGATLLEVQFADRL